MCRKSVKLPVGVCVCGTAPVEVHQRSTTTATHLLYSCNLPWNTATAGPDSRISWFTCAVVGNSRQVCLSVERNRLITRVIARHETLAAVNAHVLRRQPIRPVPSVKVCCHCSRMPYSYKYCAANPLSIKLQPDFCVWSFTNYFVHFLSNFNAFIYTKVILVRVTFHNRLQFFDRFPS